MILSDPSVYTGGSFLIEGPELDPSTGEKETLLSRPPKGSVLFFNSNVLHGVEPITTGVRTVLVFELWSRADATVFDLRPGVREICVLYLE